MKLALSFLMLCGFWFASAKQGEMNPKDSTYFSSIESCIGLETINESRACTAEKLEKQVWKKLEEKGHTNLATGKYLMSYMVRSDESVSFEKIIRLPQTVGNKTIRDTENKLVLAFKEVLQEQEWIFPQKADNPDYGVGVIENLKIEVK